MEEFSVLWGPNFGEYHVLHPAGNWYLAGRVVATAGESMASKVDFFSGYKL